MAFVRFSIGRREVPEAFCVEATSGETFALSDNRYYGIEGVWSSENYWVNMQRCDKVCLILILIFFFLALVFFFFFWEPGRVFKNIACTNRR